MPVLLMFLLLAPTGSVKSNADYDMTGTWEVKTTPSTVNTCGTSVKPGIYNWVISDQPGSPDMRSLAVQVTTETSFPKMAGTREHENNRIFVFGRCPGKKCKTTSFVEATLDVQHGTFAGRRVFSGQSKGKNHCVVEWTVTGRKL